MTNKIKKRYNRIAKVYDILDQPMEAGFSEWRKKMLHEVTGKTLEVGIGTGENLPFYARSVELTGIDFSEKMIEKARNKNNRPKKRSYWKWMHSTLSNCIFTGQTSTAKRMTIY